MNKTQRGFYIYTNFKDINGQKIQVQESSLATDIACWIFISPSENNPDYTPFKIHMGEKLYPAIQLNVRQARQLIKNLEKFISKNRFSEERMEILK